MEILESLNKEQILQILSDSFCQHCEARLHERILSLYKRHHYETSDAADDDNYYVSPRHTSYKSRNGKYYETPYTDLRMKIIIMYPLQMHPTSLGMVMDTWLAYAPVKNNPEDAAKLPKGNPYHSATSGEMAIYRANSLILKKVGVRVPDPMLQVFNGQEVELWPRIVWKPKWSLTFSQIKSKISGNSSISQRSTLAIKGQNIFLENLSLDGTLIVDAGEIFIKVLPNISYDLKFDIFRGM